MAELYDLQADPEESTNLINDAKYQSTIEQMQTRLERAMNAVGLDESTDKMPIDAGIGTELPDKAIR